MGKSDEGHRADGLDDRASLRNRLREAWAQQAPLEADHGSFRASQGQWPAAELVLGGLLNNGELRKVPGCAVAQASARSRHESGQVLKPKTGEAAAGRDCRFAAELSARAGAAQARH